MLPSCSARWKIPATKSAHRRRDWELICGLRVGRVVRAETYISHDTPARNLYRSNQNAHSDHEPLGARYRRCRRLFIRFGHTRAQGDEDDAPVSVCRPTKLPGAALPGSERPDFASV